MMYMSKICLEFHETGQTVILNWKFSKFSRNWAILDFFGYASIIVIASNQSIIMN